MNAGIAQVLCWAVAAAYGRLDDVSIELVREEEDYVIQVSEGGDEFDLRTVDECIDHIKELAD